MMVLSSVILRVDTAVRNVPNMLQTLLTSTGILPLVSCPYLLNIAKQYLANQYSR